MGRTPDADARLIDIVIPIRPVAQARVRGAFIGGHVRMYTPGPSRKFQDQLSAEIAASIGPGFKAIDFAVFVEISVWIEKPRSVRRDVPSVKPDLDNFEKAIMDACTKAGLWRDDALVVTKVSRKRYGKPAVRIAVRRHLTDD